MINMIWLLPVTFLISLIATWLVRWYAIRRKLFDVPNLRSSHTVPTPRGGGVAIVLSFLLSFPALYAMDLISFVMLWSLGGGGLLVSLIGFCDDHSHVAARWRLLAHFVASVWGVAWLGGMPPLAISGVVIDFGYFGGAVAVLYLMWMLNLYNFMDGIDGIAGVEAVTVCLGGVILYMLQGYTGHTVLLLLLMAAAAGFLVWNLPPARIFMGDAGSGFLGVVLGLLSLQAAWISSKLFLAWLILLGVFISDATITLIFRMLRGERIYEAHRSHAYQRASKIMGRHLPVTICVGIINIVWLLPLACWVVLGGNDIVGFVLAYFPIVALAIFLGAGQKD